MLGIIYKVTNKSNGKIYIGQTTTSLAERRKQHIFNAFSTTQPKYPFQLAIKKYGVAGFTWEIIDVANTQEELNQKEIKWIAFCKSYLDSTKGYNRTPGGNAFPEEERAILQYDYHGNFIHEYPHAHGASETLKFDSRGIRRSCQSKCLMYRGQVFLYKDSYGSHEKAEHEVKRRMKALSSCEKNFYLSA